jgi:hypothetical protein
MFSPSLLENAKNHLSEVIGLDAFYKLCTDHWAVAVLVCKNKKNNHFGKKNKKKTFFYSFFLKQLGLPRNRMVKLFPK